MKFTTRQDGTTLEIIAEGRLDTVSAPDLEEALMPVVNQYDKLIYDFSKLDYISSAGLRVLLRAHRGMKIGGKTIIRNANNIVREVLNVTGLNSVLDVE